MDARDIGRKVLTSRARNLLLDAGTWLLYRNIVRKGLVQALDRHLSSQLDPSDRVPPTWQTIMRQRALVYRAVLHTVDRVIARRLLAPQVARVIAERWGRALSLPTNEQPAAGRFRQEHGQGPPWFLVLGPGHACNLHCPGCYADSGPGTAKLEWSILDRVVTEARRLWGVPLFVFSGGEPLAYRSNGKDILDLVEKHDECLFLMFTNGTLIDQKMAARLARLGNLTPALSVEGMRSPTDRRRGTGMFDRVLAAMADLRQAGVPFGISVTATRANCQEILSEEFLDFFFDVQGAFYGFLFQYTPIGREPELELVPTPAQRAEFWQRSWEVIAQKQIFLLDFWNHGPLVEGCISAGRDQGYLYIDWNGKVMPCVFAPYSPININQVYAQGGTLDDVWASPFFAAVRQWQREYGYGQDEVTAEHNWLRPCPFRDHHDLFRSWIACYQLEPADEAARLALDDEKYADAMIACGMSQRAVTQQIWEQEYLGWGVDP